MVIKRHFPTLIEDLSELGDYRHRPQYHVEEIYMACISMFLFKRASRNSMNNTSEKGLFRDNYAKLFGLQLPHMDTVNLFLEQSDPAYIEAIKLKMVQCLINKKVLRKFRLSERYVVAVDATGISCYDYEPWPGCPYKEFKSGKTLWQVPVLEAKLVCINGFSLSLCTQWILNTGDYQKQNCEQTAFSGLADKIKKDFPRLPVIIVADGLYPNNTVFDKCDEFGWDFMITLKDGNLKTFWEEIHWQLRITNDNTFEKILLNKPKHKLNQRFRFLNKQPYGKHELNWMECVEKEVKKQKTTETRFVYVTSIEVTKENVYNLCTHARQRWNIENEGFDTQKHHGYGLEHKFSRKSLNARQNYYQCLQIAHIINQMAEKTIAFVKDLCKKETMKSLWETLIAFMWLIEVDVKQVEDICKSNCQLRF